MQCQSVRSPYCRDHQKCFYLKEKGCPTGQICTACEFGNTTHPTKCRCENPPFSIPVLYGQECNMGQVCTEGQGICYRPCDTYLHITLCENTDHCRWNQTTYACEAKPPPMPLVEWALLPKGNPYSQGTQILGMMGAALFPQPFEDFKKSADGYMLQGILLQDLIQLESMFLQLDQNNDGLLQATEYAKLPNTLSALDAAALQQKTAQGSATRRLEDGVYEQELQAFNDETPHEQEFRQLQSASGTTTTDTTTIQGTTMTTSTMTPAPAPAASTSLVSRTARSAVGSPPLTAPSRCVCGPRH